MQQKLRVKDADIISQHFKDTVRLHIGKFPRQGAPVDTEKFRQLVPVKTNMDQTVCGLILLAEKDLDFVPQLSLAHNADFLIEKDVLPGKIEEKI